VEPDPSPTAADATNANANSDDENEWVPANDLADQWGVTQPRMQRALKRKEFAPYAERRPRLTATGMRTPMCVSIHVLPRLKAFLSSDGGEQKRKQERAEALPSTEQNEQMRALIQAVTQEMRTRLEEQASTIADLRQDKAEWRQEREQLQSKVLALEAAPAPDTEAMRQQVEAAEARARAAEEEAARLRAQLEQKEQEKPGILTRLFGGRR